MKKFSEYAGKGRCYFCHSIQDLQEHHIFYGTANRKISDKYGLTVYLCIYHHTVSQKCVHNNREIDMQLKKDGQQYFEKYIGTRSQFIKEFGKNYL